MDRVWPLHGKEVDTIIPPTKEWWAEMKEKQKIIDKNIQDARSGLKDKRRG